MVLASRGPLTGLLGAFLGRLGGLLGRLEAILGRLGALGAILGLSWGSLGPRPEVKPSLRRVCRDLAGVLVFRGPQWPPRTRKVVVHQDYGPLIGASSTSLARGAGELFRNNVLQCSHVDMCGHKR